MGPALDPETDSTPAILAAAQALAPRIEAAAEQIERERRLTPEVVAGLQNAGLFRLVVPRSLGGMELSLAGFAEVIEEVAKADASTAWCLSQNAGICRVAAYLPRNGAKEIFGRPDMVLAWGNGPATAVEVEGGYRLTGRWSFASGIHHATWAGTGQECPIVNEAGEPNLDINGRPRHCVLLFPAAAIEIQDVWQVSGLCGTGSDSYTVTDLFVPESYSAREAPLEPGPLYVFNYINIFSVGFASVALGIARACLDAFRTLSITKTPRGISGVLREQPTVQAQIARAEAGLRSARALLHQTMAEAWAAVSATKDLGLDNRVLLRLATTHAMQRSAEVVDAIYYAAGATAIFNANPFERRFRDMHAATQHLQAREDHYIAAGKYFLGLDPDHHWL